MPLCRNKLEGRREVDERNQFPAVSITEVSLCAEKHVFPIEIVLESHAT